MFATAKTNRCNVGPEKSLDVATLKCEQKRTIWPGGNNKLAPKSAGSCRNSEVLAEAYYMARREQQARPKVSWFMCRVKVRERKQSLTYREVMIKL